MTALHPFSDTRSIGQRPSYVLYAFGHLASFPLLLQSLLSYWFDQVLKQLFDIGQLFDHLTDLRVVRDSYFSVLVKEGGYRKITGLPECALYDTLQTSYEICTFESRRHKLPNDAFIRKGIKSMASDLINQTQFFFPQARVAAAKAAYLVVLLLTDGRKNDYAQSEEIVAELKMLMACLSFMMLLHSSASRSRQFSKL